MESCANHFMARGTLGRIGTSPIPASFADWAWFKVPLTPVIFEMYSEALKESCMEFEKEYETKIEVIGYGPNIANSARF